MSDAPETQDILVFLNPKDLVGRNARKRKGRVYTSSGELCVNIWLAHEVLEGVRIGRVEYTQSAAAKYLWHRRQVVDEMVQRSHAMTPSP